MMSEDSVTSVIYRPGDRIKIVEPPGVILSAVLDTHHNGDVGVVEWEPCGVPDSYYVKIRRTGYTVIESSDHLELVIKNGEPGYFRSKRFQRPSGNILEVFRCGGVPEHHNRHWCFGWATRRREDFKKVGTRYDTFWEAHDELVEYAKKHNLMELPVYYAW